MSKCRTKIKKNKIKQRTKKKKKKRIRAISKCTDRSSPPEMFRKNVVKLFLEIWQNSQENTFFHRTPLMSAFV